MRTSTRVSYINDGAHGAPYKLRKYSNWSECEDLNLGPSAPRAVALPGCATLRKTFTAQVGCVITHRLRASKLHTFAMFFNPHASHGCRLKLQAWVMRCVKWCVIAHPTKHPYFKLVRMEGLEPPILSALVSKTSVYSNSTTCALTLCIIDSFINLLWGDHPESNRDKWNHNPRLSPLSYGHPKTD